MDCPFKDKDESRRKEKKKKKDKDREKYEGQTPIPKLTIKGHTPAGSPTRDHGSGGPLKLKIKLGGTPAVE